MLSASLAIYSKNRFHVTVRLFSNRSQMTSKCAKNKKVAHKAIAECVTDVLKKKITPLSNVTQRASRGIKTYSESRIELRNLQILK